MLTDDNFPLVFNIYISPLLKPSIRHGASLAKMDVRVLLGHFAATLQYVIGNLKCNLSAV
jgi:hypothetical protein